MSGSELRTYCLSAVLTVLLGAGGGVAWHYFADSAGARAVALAATPPVQGVPSPPSLNPTAPREGPAPDVPRSSDAQQPARSIAINLADEEKLALVALLTN